MSNASHTPNPPCNLPLVAKYWDKIYEGSAMRRDPGPLVPDYTSVLLTISKLAFVCGLGLSDVLEHKHSSTGNDSGMPYAPAEAFSMQQIAKEELDQRAIEAGLKDSGVDWLGIYVHDSDRPLRIELYLSRCWRTAKFLGVRAKDLVEAVLTHEAAHFVSHIGIGGYNHTQWEKFSDATREDKEDVAQIACWAVFTVFERPDLIKVMRTLANHQSDIYNSWRDFEKACSPFLDKPLDIIGKLTVKIANVSGRKAQSVVLPEDLHNILEYNS